MSENRKKIIIYSRLIAQHGWIAVMAKKHGLEIYTVENGVSALERSKIEMPGFVLLDVSMPKMSGIECGREIKEFSNSVHVMLISSVHSLSLQDSAKRARIGLFVVESVANVKVPEFVEAMLNRKELPPDVSETIEREVLSKRSTQRFPFEGEVQYQIGDEWLSGIFVNVSQDGLLFQSKNSVEAGTKVMLSWMDHGKKHIEISAIVVRQISSEHPQYPFLIGVQFLKASAAIDQKISELSDEIDVFQENTAAELDMDLIQEMLNERKSYFRDMFQGGKAPLFVELSITDIVEHERNSFQQQDDYSKCLQELVSSRILCQMFGNSIEQLSNSKSSMKSYSTRLVTIMSELLEKIEYAEGDSDKIVKKSIQESKVTERHQINESNNRLYQAKADVLRIFCQKIKREDIAPTHQSGYDQIVTQNKQLTSYQEHLDEIAKEEERERKQMATTRITKPIEKPAPEPAQKKTKMTVVQEDQIKKTSYIPFVALFIVLMATIPWVEELMKVHFTHNDLTLLMKPDDIERKANDSLLISVTGEAWNKLGDKGREVFLDQVEVYLTRKKLHQCKIMDGDRLVAAVYGSFSKDQPVFLHNIFLDEEKPVEPVKAPVVVKPTEIQQPMEISQPAQVNKPVKTTAKLKSKSKAAASKNIKK